MKAAKKGPKAPKIRRRTTLSRPSSQRASRLLAVNLIAAALMTAANRAKALVSLAYSSAS
jgi:hypothetical protein